MEFKGLKKLDFGFLWFAILIIVMYWKDLDIDEKVMF
jgi:hypothetical protein